MKADTNLSLNYIQKIKQLFQGNQAEKETIRLYLLRGSVGVFVLQTISIGLGLITNMLLARILGVAEYGVYTYIFAWTGLFTVLAMFGFSNVLVREIAAYQAKEEWGKTNIPVRFSIFSFSFTSCPISFVTCFNLYPYVRLQELQ